MVAHHQTRIESLRRLRLLDAAARAAFDRLTHLAATLLNVPVFVSLLDEERHFILSQWGFPDDGASARGLSGTLWHHATTRDAPVVIPDARTGAVGRDTDTGESAGIAAYIAIPLRLSSGQAIGIFCAIDTTIHKWTERDVEILTELAASTVTEIELRDATAAADIERKRYRDLVEDLDAIVWEMDAGTWRFTFVNQHAEDILGYPASQWIEEPGFWQDRILHPDDRESAVRFCMNATEQGRDHEFDYRAIAADGHVVWLQDRVHVITSANRTTLLRGVMIDITERKRAAQALSQSEEQFRQITENVRELFWIFDPTFTHTIYVSPQYEVLWGRSLESIYADARTFVDAVHPDDVDVLRAAMAEVREDVVGGVEYRVIRPDGEIRWMFSRGFPVRNEQGEVYRVVGTTDDITEQRSLESERAAAEAHYRRLVMNAPYAIYALDREAHFTELNPAGEVLLGRSAAEMLGRGIGDVIAPGDLPLAQESLRRKLIGEIETSDLEIHLIHSSGARRLTHIRAAAIRENGVVIGTHGIARDITEERAHQEEARLLAAALHSLDEGVAISGFDGHIIYANETHARLLGYDPDRSPLPHLSEFTADEPSRRRFMEAVQSAAEHGTWTGRISRRRLDDGRIVPLELILGRVDRDPGESLLFTIARDVTDEVRKEQHLRRAERLASVGTLIAGVAHELNNPLNSITNFATLLMETPRSAEDAEDIATIHREALRAAKIVSDLRLLARDTQEEVREHARVDLNDIVQHVLRTRQYSLNTRNIDARQDLARDLPEVWGDRGQLEQVVINLVVNAEQAMAAVEGDRRLIVRTRMTGEGVSLHVVDSGPGIPAEYLDRIFDPFFTTKTPGEGTGLGLSLVYSIVAEHGGEVHVESEAEKGTAFRVDLPRAQKTSFVPGESRVVPGHAAEPLRILVVDDEPAIRRALSRYLGRRGHDVEMAGDGNEALRLIEDATTGAGYDVILSDLRMPGLGGDQLMERLRQQSRGLERRVMFLTGDAASGDAARILAAANVPVIYKPVELADLAARIERYAREIVGRKGSDRV